MLRGEVWWVDFDPSLGGEIQKTRPAVIVSNDASNLIPEPGASGSDYQQDVASLSVRSCDRTEWRVAESNGGSGGHGEQAAPEIQGGERIPRMRFWLAMMAGI
jgi:PemK-like, MazF-like toxin of type II toxin-antitoxin system